VKLPSIPRRLTAGVALAVQLVSGALFILYDIPSLLGLSGNVAIGGAWAIGAIVLGWVVWDQSKEIALLREDDDRHDIRRTAIGTVIRQAQAIDKEICALRGADRTTREDEFAQRLTDWHGMALTTVRLYYPEREGYYLSDAGLPPNSGILPAGWRDRYVAELRRRIIRLNELQSGD
jgi:hypothetical protein